MAPPEVQVHLVADVPPFLNNQCRRTSTRGVCIEYWFTLWLMSLSALRDPPLTDESMSTYLCPYAKTRNIDIIRETGSRVNPGNYGDVVVLAAP
jgi:hypothetical protein